MTQNQSGQPKHQRLPARRGFTLLELLVAIVVISILAAFLLPAIQGIVGTTKDAAVRNEISQMESAIATFKQKYGIEPPSSIVICESSMDWTSNTSSKALIQRMWPNYDFADQDLNNDGTPDDVFALDGSASLVFFLGGVVKNSGTPGEVGSPQGFSKNPSKPFAIPAVGEVREGPYFEFAPSRLRKAPGLSSVITDDFQILQYSDQFANLDGLYIYLSSYDGSGYVDADIPAAIPLGKAYQTSANGPAQKPKSFQIISPGADGIYGGNKDETLSDGSVVFNTTESNNGLKTNKFAYDNITNFAPGRLRP